MDSTSIAAPIFFYITSTLINKCRHRLNTKHMSTKGSHKRTLNRDDKKLAEHWDQIDFKRKPADAKKVKETKIGAKTRITYG